MALTEIKTDKYHYFEDEDGKIQGEYKFWWDNGQLWEHCFYKDGKCHGESKRWHSNGQLWEHCFYNNKEVINFKDNPEQYPASKEDKIVFALKYGSGQCL